MILLKERSNSNAALTTFSFGWNDGSPRIVLIYNGDRYKKSLLAPVLGRTYGFLEACYVAIWLSADLYCLGTGVAASKGVCR